MVSFVKWMFVNMLFLFGNAAISNAPVQTNAGAGPSLSFQSYSAFSQNRKAQFPSHGYAMLILRYNEDSRDKAFINLLGVPLSTPVIGKTATELTNDKGFRQNELSFTDNSPCYEAFLYSLPLRSPPAIC